MKKDIPILEMMNITMAFPGVKALDRVSLKAYSGEVLALVGENGAGKSTLMKVLSGVWPYPQYKGKLKVKNKIRRFRHTHDAEDIGIAIIYQELNLIYDLTVAENIFLDRQPCNFMGLIDWNQLYADAAGILKQLHMDNIRPDELVSELSVGQQQMVEIAKALSQKAEILILDEPTSALSDRETEELFQVINRLKKENVAMLYISHKMEEIKRIADKVQVLRDGQNIDDASPTDSISLDEIITRMVGRDISTMYPKHDTQKGKKILEVKNIVLDHPLLEHQKLVDNVSFDVCQGEILGISGLMGSGRTELVMSIFGATTSHYQGEILLDGKKLKIRQPKDAIKAGLALVTEDRKLQGLVLEQDIMFNTTLASLENISTAGVLDKYRERSISEKFNKELGTKAASLELPVNTLSGGNQQKVVIAKWLATAPRVLILDDPTRGIDIGAKVEIYKLMNKLIEQGVCVVMISSELPEILGMCDRILVMHEGKMVGDLERKDADEEKIMALSTGHE